MSFNKGKEGARKAEGISHKSQFKHCSVSEHQANSFEDNGTQEHPRYSKLDSVIASMTAFHSRCVPLATTSFATALLAEQEGLSQSLSYDTNRHPTEQ